ncbi:DUF2800 domain-containing protein [Pseudobutyrivibrio sp.]
MKWNDHSKLIGSHAFLSPSKSSWLRKTDDELVDAKKNSYAQQIGTLLHAYAADCIKFRERMKKTDSRGVKFDLMRNGIPEYAIDMDVIYPTFMNYVNDAVGFRLDPEVPLYYSDECYGTADAINLDGKVLRIHDLKTGRTEAKMDQLMVYAGLFYLEYGYKPEKIPAALRIYQMGEVVIYEPEADDVRDIMDQIVAKNSILQRMKQEGI